VRPWQIPISKNWLKPLNSLTIGNKDGTFTFRGESDAMIVRGLIAVLRTLYNDQPVADVLKTDATAELGRLGLNDHLSAQRSNGLRAMVERIRETAAAA